MKRPIQLFGSPSGKNEIRQGFGRFVAALMLTSFNLSSAMANGYDQCKDILRDGVRDQISSQTSLDHRVAAKRQFCNIANEHKLNSSNYNNFARNYARSSSTSRSEGGGGFQLAIGPIELGAGGGGGGSNEEDSEQSRINLLMEKRTNVLDYYRRNCSAQSHNESLQSEALLTSKIASDAVTEAWRDCMLRSDHTGFFAVLTHSASGDTQVDYHVDVYWTSRSNVLVDSLKYTYRASKLEASHPIGNTIGDWVTSVDLCNSSPCMTSGARIPIALTHINLKEDASVVIAARTNTGSQEAHTISFPKRPEEPVVPPPPPPSTSENLCRDLRARAYNSGLVEDYVLIEMAARRNMAPLILRDGAGQEYIEGWHKCDETLRLLAESRR